MQRSALLLEGGRVYVAFWDGTDIHLSAFDVDGIVTKPYTSRQLVEKLKAVMEKRAGTAFRGGG